MSDKFPKPKSQEETKQEAFLYLDKSIETLNKMEDNMKVFRFNFACAVSLLKQAMEKDENKN